MHASAHRILVLALCAMLALACGCNVVQMQEDEALAELRSQGVEHRTAQLENDEVEYWVGGKGTEVVLLIHGFGADATWQWAGQAEDLASDHIVVMPNLLWFGDSTSTEKRYTAGHQIEMLNALMDHIGAKQFHLVGTSYGGILAYEIAALYPERVASLTMINSPGRFYEAEDYDKLCTHFEVNDIADVLVPDDAAGVRQLLEVAYETPPWTPDFALEQAYEQLYAKNRAEKVALIEDLVGSIDTSSELPGAVQARTLVVWGANDQVFPLHLGELLSSKIEETAPVELAIIEDARHAPQLEHPAKVNALIRTHISNATNAVGY